MSNTINNGKIDGMLYPSQKGMISGNPRDSAIQMQKNIDTIQTNLINRVGGKKIKYKKRGGNTSSIVVPQFTMNYTPQGADGQDPNSIIKMNSLISTQASANSVYDKYALQNGGKQQLSRKRKLSKHKKSLTKHKSIKRTTNKRRTRKYIK